MRKKIIFSGLALLLGVVTASAQGTFIPDDPVFDPGTIACPARFSAGSICKRLAKDFAYIRADRGFEAAAGLVTDGASIPRWAQKYIGKPHDKGFIRAAVLHDHYVLKEHAVISYLATQNLFYQALLDSRVPKKKAMLMYAAVVVGAPKWSLFYRAKPEECKTPMAVPCVRNEGDLPVDDVISYVEAAFDHPGFEAALALIENSAAFEAEDLGELEKAALEIRDVLGLPTPPPAAYGDE